MDKWGYIIRSIKNQTDNISFDLTGGFDTRSALPILLHSNINLKEILINSINDNKSVHEQDYQIASNISSKYGLKLNNVSFDPREIRFNINDSLICEYYTKLGFHKSLNLNNSFYINPRFSFTGGGGETIRGFPGVYIEEYIKFLLSDYKQIKGHEEEFYNSSIRLLKRSINLLKKEKKINNLFDIAPSFYIRGPAVNHFGKISLKFFLRNRYLFQPLMDPDLKKIKFNINKDTNHDMIAYIYVRFAPDLIQFPFEGNKILNYKSIEKAKTLNKLIKSYESKTDFNPNFYIDFKRHYEVSSSYKIWNHKRYMENLFISEEFVHNINQKNNNSIYEWACEFRDKTDFMPLKHLYGLLAISKTIGLLTLNNNLFKKL